jgi:hypothetical protein
MRVLGAERARKVRPHSSLRHQTPLELKQRGFTGIMCPATPAVATARFQRLAQLVLVRGLTAE